MRMLAVLVIVFTVITVLAVLLAYYNFNHAADNSVYLICNFAVLALSYILIAIVSTYYAFHKYEVRMSKFVDTDRLTNGINYEKFLKEAQHLLDEKNDTTYAVFYADIQNFKYINDTFGYDVGDNLLMYISQRIKEAIGNSGNFARISADNYTAIVPYVDKNEFVEHIYSIIDDICWFEDIQKAHYKPEIYVGIYCSGEAEAELTISEMIDRANMAQKSIKGSSEYHIAFYTEEIRERVIAEKELERRMDTALANEEFKVYFQPKYEVSSGEIVGAEALVRWDSPETGFMSPAKFIPLFEQNGFIINLDQFVFETVCKNMREWLDAGVKVVPVSINVSRLQFYRLDFVKRYTKIKEKYDIPDGYLELEFTESIVFENLEILRKIVMTLKKVGFSCSIDDFGSGYSSLNILKNLPMDTLKLDKLFFNDSENLERDKALISSVVTMSRALNMKTVAEGIENWAQVNFLKEIGCDIIQGYVYSEPIPHARYTNLLEGNRRKVMPAEYHRGKSLQGEVDPTIAAYKNTALLRLLSGLLVEVNFDADTYEFVNSKGAPNWDLPLKGTGFSEVCAKMIERYVHPDDVKVANNRCSNISVMSAFYQKEINIITEMRIFMDSTKSYEWCRVSIVRINTNPEAHDFRAYLYIESTAGSEPASVDNKTLISESVRSALMNICSLIYEFDLKNGVFKKLYCNTELIGNQPDSGDISWAHECYFPKVLEKSELDKVKKFCAPENVDKAFASGKENIVIRTRANVGGKHMSVKITIAKPPQKHDGETDNKYLFICYVEDEEK